MGGISCVLVLMVLVRPVAVGVSTMGLPLNWRQRLFMGCWHRGDRHRSCCIPVRNPVGTGGVLRAGRLQGLVFLRSDDSGIAGAECPTAGQSTWVDAGGL